MYQDGTSVQMLWTCEGGQGGCQKMLSANLFLKNLFHSMYDFVWLHVCVLEQSSYNVDFVILVLRDMKKKKRRGAVRKDNSSVTGWDLCGGVCTAYVRVCGCACVCVWVCSHWGSEGHPEWRCRLCECVCIRADTFGACAMALIVCIHLHLQRRHKQAVEHTTDSITKLALIWIRVLSGSEYFSLLVERATHSWCLQHLRCNRLGYMCWLSSLTKPKTCFTIHLSHQVYLTNWSLRLKMRI